MICLTSTSSPSKLVNLNSISMFLPETNCILHSSLAGLGIAWSSLSVLELRWYESIPTGPILITYASYVNVCGNGLKNIVTHPVTSSVIWNDPLVVGIPSIDAQPAESPYQVQDGTLQAYDNPGGKFCTLFSTTESTGTPAKAVSISPASIGTLKFTICYW